MPAMTGQSMVVSLDDWSRDARGSRTARREIQGTTPTAAHLALSGMQAVSARKSLGATAHRRSSAGGRSCVPSSRRSAGGVLSSPPPLRCSLSRSTMCRGISLAVDLDPWPSLSRISPARLWITKRIRSAGLADARHYWLPHAFDAVRREPTRGASYASVFPSSGPVLTPRSS
jgi:hypothetical protein